MLPVKRLPPLLRSFAIFIEQEEAANKDESVPRGPAYTEIALEQGCIEREFDETVTQAIPDHFRACWLGK